MTVGTQVLIVMTETSAGEDETAEEAGIAPLFVDSAGADDTGAGAEEAGATDETGAGIEETGATEETGAGTDEATTVEVAGTAALVVDSDGVATEVYDGTTEVTVYVGGAAAVEVTTA